MKLSYVRTAQTKRKRQTYCPLDVVLRYVVFMPFAEKWKTIFPFDKNGNTLSIALLDAASAKQSEMTFAEVPFETTPAERPVEMTSAETEVLSKLTPAEGESGITAAAEAVSSESILIEGDLKVTLVEADPFNTTPVEEVLETIFDVPVEK
ncbi:hypothetical protein Bhyg_09552 [Pseudolycoriella hygida]|uniref:Uncharacterized protein n=1 Tax=Pseudolycoriella hygida TaxID=35572 RepID=A0A9Q0N6R9_9DIPT|nr:hypothetical protein Bhyg_09552 [Pseudolycoriella hygida]